MKKTISLLLSLNMVCQVAQAQKALLIQRTDGVTDALPTSAVDSLSFSDDGTQLLLTCSSAVTSLACADVSSIQYAEAPATLTVSYEGEKAVVINPYLAKGVSVQVNGANVVIDNRNVSEELTFELSGATDNGSFVYNADYKSTIILAGVSITSTKGPAVDIQCGKRVALQLKKNTESTLVDGKKGDWKAALYCKGHLEIDKNGTLNVTGNTKHAIAAKEYIQLKKADGTINILASKSDGIHCGQYFLANGFTVNIDNKNGDGIQAEESLDEAYEEDYPDGSLWIQGGTFTINCSADGAAGLKSDADIVINAAKSTPKINITMTGDDSHGMKAGGAVKIEAGEVTVVDSTTK